MNEAISKILNHLQREQEEGFDALYERLDSYTWIDGYVFEPLGRERTRRVRNWIHAYPNPDGVETYVYTYRGRIHLEFDYEVFDMAPVERLRAFEKVIEFCRRLADAFPAMRSEWCSCVYGLHHAYFRIRDGRIQVAEPVTRPDESRIRTVG